MSAGICLPKVYSAHHSEASRCFQFMLSFLVFTISLANGLRITNMSSPMVADLRDKLTLDCKFDMGAEQLYAVKWYKDEQEFFRYMPSGTPSTMSFPVAGVHLLGSSTNCTNEHCRLVLHNLNRDHSGGAYRCEISSEAPAFRLASQTNNVTVAALPRGEPRIVGLASDYLEGEMVSAECVSEPADPAPILSWYINGYQAPRKFVGEMNSSKPDPQGLVSKTLSLRFSAEKKLFHGDHLEISCRSSLPGIPIRPQSTDKTIMLKSQPAQPVINNQKLHWLSSSSSGACKVCFNFNFYGRLLFILFFVHLDKILIR